MTTDDLPDYVEVRLRKAVPTGVPVVPLSTPVLSFGSTESSSIATLGLNPSVREFYDQHGELLSGANRRLADLSHLGVGGLEHAPLAVVQQVYADSVDYFHRAPYWQWFGPLERVLAGARTSYKDGSACHLDLVQWATNPVWSHLPKAQRQSLIDDDAEFLRHQLRRENIGIVLANGRSVIDALRASLVSMEQCGEVSSPSLSAKLFTGAAGGVQFFGWTCNLQSQAGALALVEPLRDAVATWTAQLEERESDMTSIERGTAVTSKDELRRVLEQWLNESDELTIGDVGAFGGKPWLYVEMPGFTVKLNADTKRTAIAAYVRAAKASSAPLPWHVIANNRGTVNKVVYGDHEPKEGWYCYTLTPLAGPVTL